MSNILLRTKLQVPQMRMSRITRPHLMLQLKQALDKKLILVSAPAGYGKTTLLTEWLSTVNEPAAWISLDKGDNDFKTFWSYLNQALQMAFTSLNEAFTNYLLPSNYLMLESCLVDLINELDKRNQTIILVLDDYQMIQSQDIHQGISFLIEHAPACLHLVIVTRADPPLNLSHLRGSSQLAEFRLADLRFTGHEISAFMQRVMKVNLSARDVSMLEEITEGWIAGLQLAGLSLQGKGNASEFIENFSGVDRFIVDFLFEEVLDTLPGHIQDFLLKTSILKRLCSSLCNSITHNEDSQTVLNYLEQHNLFLISLDEQRKWYRYHHLFRDLLMNRLIQTQHIDPRLLFQRACSWYEGEGEFELAVSHAHAAQDFEHMAVLLEKIVRTLDLQNQQLMFTSWLEKLPIDVIQKYPWLCIYRAWGAYWTGNEMNDQDDWLLFAGKAVDTLDQSEEKQKILGYIATIKAHRSLSEKNVPEAMDMANMAIESLPGRDPMRCEALVALAGSYWALGDTIQTKKMFGLTRDTALSQNYYSMAAGSSVYLGIQQVKQGLLTDAIASFREGLRLACLPEGRETPMVGIAYCRLGDVWREQNKLAAAVDVLKRGLIQCQILGQPDFLADAYLCDARYQLTIGDLDAAHDRLDRIDSLTRQTRVDPWILCWRDDCRIRVWLAEKNLEAINLWEQNCALSIDDPLDYQQDLHHQNLARVLVARHVLEPSKQDYQDADILLNRLLTATRFAGWVHEGIRILILKAIHFQCSNKIENAVQSLLHAVVLACPGKFMRVFLDEGVILFGLFKRLCEFSDADLKEVLTSIPIAKNQPSLEEIKICTSAIYAAFNEAPKEVMVDREIPAISSHLVIDGLKEPPVEKLTPRELEILKLLARGYPDKKIAETLVITRETVHKHLKNIYNKLGVHSRTEAVIHGQALGLLSNQ